MSAGTRNRYGCWSRLVTKTPGEAIRNPTGGRRSRILKGEMKPAPLHRSDFVFRQGYVADRPHPGPAPCSIPFPKPVFRHPRGFADRRGISSGAFLRVRLSLPTDGPVPPVISDRPLRHDLPDQLFFEDPAAPRFRVRFLVIFRKNEASESTESYELQ